LSTLSDEEVERIVSDWNIDEPKDYGGPNAVTSMKALYLDLERVRRDGYAIIMEEAEIGVCAVAVGIYDPTEANTLLGVLSVAGPTARLDKKKLKSMVPEMKETAGKIQEHWSLWASVNTDRAKQLVAV
jgi:DNA-binding IclR family transcriptional regulator